MSSPEVLQRCRFLAGSGDFTNDVPQYWLGAYLLVDNGGAAGPGALSDVTGVDEPFQQLGDRHQRHPADQ
jgi:hypothetical protein